MGHTFTDLPLQSIVKPSESFKERAMDIERYKGRKDGGAKKDGRANKSTGSKKGAGTKKGGKSFVFILWRLKHLIN